MAKEKMQPGDEEKLALWRVLQEKLMAPLPENEISWRPGQFIERNGTSNFFPYVSAPSYRARLDEVLGYANWSADYKDLEGSNLTICKLSLELDSEIVIREGIGAHKPRAGANTDNAELDEEHGSRTKAFRDACKQYGLCGGHWIDGLVTPFLKVSTYETNGKVRVGGLLEPLPALKDCKRAGQAPEMKESNGNGGSTPYYSQSSPGGSARGTDPVEEWEKVELKYGALAGKKLGDLSLDELQDLFDQNWVQKSSFYKKAVEAGLNVREAELASGP